MVRFCRYFVGSQAYRGAEGARPHDAYDGTVLWGIQDEWCAHGVLEGGVGGGGESLFRG